MAPCAHWRTSNKEVTRQSYFCNNPLHALLKAITVKNLSVVLLVWQAYTLSFEQCLDKIELCGTFGARSRGKLRKYGYLELDGRHVVGVQSVFGICFMTGIIVSK